MARKAKSEAEKKHDHEEPKPCEHELKHCPVCDTVYCVKCGKEWKVQTSYWHYTNPITISTPDYLKPPYVITSGTNTVDGDQPAQSQTVSSPYVFEVRCPHHAN